MVLSHDAEAMNLDWGNEQEGSVVDVDVVVVVEMATSMT